MAAADRRRRTPDSGQPADRDRLAAVLRRCLVRPAKDAELARFQGLLDEARQYYGKQPDAAKAMIGKYAVAGVSRRRDSGLDRDAPHGSESGRVHHTGVIPMASLEQETRRRFLGNMVYGIGAAALGQWLAQDGLLAPQTARAADAGLANPLAPKPPHFAPKAKNCIFIFLEGAPSQIDLFDPKPKLNELNGQPLPESMTKNVRFAFIKKETGRADGLAAQVHASTASAAWSSATCCRTWPRAPTTC